MTTSFEDIADTSSGFLNAIVDQNGDPATGLEVAGTDILPAGSAIYDGYISGNYDGADVIGVVTLTTDLTDLSVSGDARDFVHEDAGTVVGSLTGTGYINTNTAGLTPQVTATLEGTLEIDDQSYDTTLGLDGYVLTADGTTADAIAGRVQGTLTGANVVTFNDGIFAVLPD